MRPKPMNPSLALFIVGFVLLILTATLKEHVSSTKIQVIDTIYVDHKPDSGACDKQNIMKTQQKTKLQLEEEYVAFLRKALDSASFKENVSKDDYEKTKKKYEKSKLKLKFLKEDAENGK